MISNPITVENSKTLEIHEMAITILYLFNNPNRYFFICYNIYVTTKCQRQNMISSDLNINAQCNFIILNSSAI